MKHGQACSDSGLLCRIVRHEKTALTAIIRIFTGLDYLRATVKNPASLALSEPDRACYSLSDVLKTQISSNNSVRA